MLSEIIEVSMPLLLGVSIAVLWLSSYAAGCIVPFFCYHAGRQVLGLQRNRCEGISKIFGVTSFSFVASWAYFAHAHNQDAPTVEGCVVGLAKAPLAMAVLALGLLAIFVACVKLWKFATSLPFENLCLRHAEETGDKVAEDEPLRTDFPEKELYLAC